MLVQPYASYIYTSNISFSVASFFLFIAILPLLYAPESLSEKIMKNHELSTYVQKAMKVADKETQVFTKSQEQSVDKKDEEPPQENEPAEEDKNYEEAQKLAEKYY